MKVEPSTESLENSDLNHLYLFFYLIPILGFFPSLWTLYRGTRRGQGSGEMGGQGERTIHIQIVPLSPCHATLRGRGKIRTQVAPLVPLSSSSPQSLASKPSSSHQPLATSHEPSHQPLATSHSLTISRLSVTLAFAWLLGYLLLNIGAETSEFLTLRLLVLNSLLTSGYFLVSIWLMVRLASGSSVRLPGFSSLAEQVFGKHLS